MIRNNNSFEADALYDRIALAPPSELIPLLQDMQLLKRMHFCDECHSSMSLNRYKKVVDGYAWRCTIRQCRKFKVYVSLRTGSFFEGFSITLNLCMKVLVRYATRTQRIAIIEGTSVSENTCHKILDKLITYMSEPDFIEDRLGGPGKNVQVDETMMNYKCKSHRGRSPLNRTDSICIIEYERCIVRAFAAVIPDKRQSTIVPIIMRQVCPGSIIHTDEHGAYCNLRDFGFSHGTVCHKYNFVDRVTGVHTQGIESFNGELKYEIKKRKGIQTEKRGSFLKEFCFYFNNRADFFHAVFRLIKV